MHVPPIHKSEFKNMFDTHGQHMFAAIAAYVQLVVRLVLSVILCIPMC